MYLIIYFLFHEIYCQCYQKYKDQTIYLSPGETLKLDLQNYIYGKQLQYSSSNDCLENKIRYNNISFLNQTSSEYSEYSLCYDPKSGVCNKMKFIIIILELGQIVQMHVLNYQATIQFYNISDTLSILIYNTTFRIDIVLILTYHVEHDVLQCSLHEIEYGFGRMQPQNQEAIKYLSDQCNFAINLNPFSTNK
ncbi:unnamed protein product (macronuclear) [Paramecium tetraurelia]|uniref:Transmembrane protein n=1 Tax=Paramecium tetraurelia TaxID=5888 RepID=A0BVT0_PARTE|nr:uncharacterized protein GSPATT00032499001 [Paramecium tetraurelia]CAK62647.1 unnamed protein product [Paramecium tetraurelia]|eukprot:XP_001430045.1 hypothetical protein (macronuclear) [Paramecium tetraurelia strain d4-2]